MDWHLLKISDVTEKLNTSSAGIDKKTAHERLVKFGENKLKDVSKKTILQLLIQQFSDLMVLILIVAAIISGLMKELTDTFIILTIVIINAIIGFIQEYRAEKVLDELEKMIPDSVTVIRNKKVVEIPSYELVPGDVIQIEAGDIIPADVRFFDAHKVKIDESPLTGESNNVSKNTEALPKGNYVLGDRSNMGYKGTFMTNGRASAYVVATGMETEIGKIAYLIQSSETKTPLQKRLRSFSKKLSFVILALATLIFVLGWLRGESLISMLLTSISLAVAAIPEALPALVTITLAFGAKRLVKSKALIKKLPAVETLGSVSYICSDKTGTLTLNKMIVQETYQINETFQSNVFNEFDPLYCSMYLNNDAVKEENNNWIGDSTEIALIQNAQKNIKNTKKINSIFPRIAELPFDSKRKCMSTLHETENGILVITKGAAEELLQKLNENQKKIIPSITNKINELAEKGYRLMAYSYKVIPKLPEVIKEKNIEYDLTLLGIVGLIDPVRPDVKKAIVDCKEAGIIPVMITGDHKLTALAIAKELGIITSEKDLVITGSELQKLSLEKFEEIVENVRVYARMDPKQKLKIITALQDKHQTIAMTGDGVNDAPALKKADIGIAMGINGTQVSKEAADLILLDDNFSTILIAVKHGRKIYENILKFIKYILTGNLGEIWAILIAPFFGLPIPLLAIHILWINLITDGFPGLALASENVEPNIMHHSYNKFKKNIFSRELIIDILWAGILMGSVTVATQAWALKNGYDNWQTMVFAVLCFSQLWYVMTIRSNSSSIFKIGLLSNKPMLLALFITISLLFLTIYLPFFNGVFKTKPLSFFEFLSIISISSIVFWIAELKKWIKRRKYKLIK